MANERIFIVEDEGIVAADLESVLTSLGYQIVGIASMGAEAVSKVEETKPDLVLMDIRLKGDMDGIDAAEQIAARLGTPVTFLTAYADEKTLGRAKTTMPYGYILKPYEENDLRTAIELALYKHKMESMIAAIDGWHATALRSIPDAVVATDKAGRLTFLNGRAESLLGWTLQDSYGKNFAEIFAPRQKPGSRPFADFIREVLNNRISTYSEDEVVVTAKDGRHIQTDCNASAIKNDDDEITGIMMVFRESVKEPRPPHQTTKPLHTS